MSIGPRLVELQEISDSRGHLGVAQSGDHVPFAIKRVFYQYGMLSGLARGDHAHHRLEQFMIALKGSFDVATQFPGGTQNFTLDRPSVGLYLPPMTWVSFKALAADGVCLVLASEIYEETDYIRDKTIFDQRAKSIYGG